MYWTYFAVITSSVSLGLFLIWASIMLGLKAIGWLDQRSQARGIARMDVIENTRLLRSDLRHHLHQLLRLFQEYLRRLQFPRCRHMWTKERL